VTGGDAAPLPSWEQLLTGAHPSFRGEASAGGWRGLARHGRDGWYGEPGLPDRLAARDQGGRAEDDAMGWGEAALWTAGAAAVASVLASRVGSLLH
jgi:hypothetical protein